MQDLEPLLQEVTKPGQYLGNEWGAFNKDWDSAKSRMALIYPDLYELGMSNFGIKILYNVVNKHPDLLCDRAYAVMPDMEELMRQHKIPLWAWESRKPLKEFDFIGFSLAYELCYTNVLNCLDLAQIPIHSKDRTDEHPIIFAGGPAVFNPEPMADFIDFFIIGDGEELITEVQEILIEGISEKGIGNREKLLLKLSQLQGIYVPSLYKLDENHIPTPNPQSLIPIPYPVKKRITQDLSKYQQPVSGPIPNVEAVQDKQVLEIRRGCDRGCRFCQVGYTYLPVRERSPEELLELSKESVKKSGYEDMTLLSLSASDYTCLTEAAKAINNEHAENGIGLSMPSQRADRFNVDLADEVSQARKSGMTFAPEAGTEKMRRIINKGLSQEEIYRAIKGSYQKGWAHIKLYFMIGLPFETDEDLDGILDILEWAANLGKENHKSHDPSSPIPNPSKRKALRITCTISTFVPKTFTAFQWFPQVSAEEFARKQQYLINGLYERRIKKQVKLNCTDPNLALIESVLSRADRRWGNVIKSIWESGSRMDSWSEHFDIERWRTAAEKNDLNLEEETSRHREPGSKQPWDVLSIGFTENFLLDEWKAAEKEIETVACTENKCHACGVCFNLDVKNVVTEKQTDINPFVVGIRDKKRNDEKKGISDWGIGNRVLDRTQEDWLKRAEELKPVLFFIDLLIENRSLIPNPQSPIPSNNKQPKVVVKNTEAKQKLRVKITKLGDLRYIGHLDFQRLIERALRRSGLPVVHTKGFNQRIKISWGTALPLFLESSGEYLEIELAEVFEDLEYLKEILNQELPKQARIRGVESVSETDNLSITKILEASYLSNLIVNKRAPEVLQQEKVDEFLQREEILITKVSKSKRGLTREKSKDIRPNIIDIQVLDSSSVKLRLKGQQRADEILNLIFPGTKFQIRKDSQILEGQELAQAV